LWPSVARAEPLYDPAPKAERDVAEAKTHPAPALTWRSPFDPEELTVMEPFGPVPPPVTEHEGALRPTVEVLARAATLL